MYTPYYFYEDELSTKDIHNVIGGFTYSAIISSLTSSLMQASATFNVGETFPFAINLLKSPIVQGVFATGMAATIQVTVALISNEQFKIIYDGKEIIYNQDGVVVEAHLQGIVPNEIVVEDLIGGTIIGVIIALAFPIETTAILAAGAIAASSVAAWVLADSLGTYVGGKISANFLFTDVRYVNANGEHVGGVLFDGTFSNSNEEYAIALQLIEAKHGDLSGGKIVFYNFDNDEIGDIRYHIYDGSVLEQIASLQEGVSFAQVLAASEATGRANHLNWAPNADGDNYLLFAVDNDIIFNDTEETALNIPIIVNDDIVTYKAHTIYEGDAINPANLVVGDWNHRDDEGFSVLMADGTSNLISGDEYNNIILGTAASEQLIGGRGDDVILGGDGDDHIAGSEGVDTLIGGSGEDTLIGGKEYSYLFGQTGKDLLVAGGSESHLYGGSGETRLR
jgi:hypothetical protein